MGLSPKILMEAVKISLPIGEGGVTGILSPKPCSMLRTAGRMKYFSFKNGSGGEFSLAALKTRLNTDKKTRKVFSDLKNLDT